MEHPKTKQPRIVVDGDLMVGLTPGASSSDRKRVGEDDPEDALRPAHYRPLEQEGGLPVEQAEQALVPTRTVDTVPTMHNYTIWQATQESGALTSGKRQ